MPFDFKTWHCNLAEYYRLPWWHACVVVRSLFTRECRHCGQRWSEDRDLAPLEMVG